MRGTGAFQGRGKLTALDIVLMLSLLWKVDSNKIVNRYYPSGKEKKYMLLRYAKCSCELLHEENDFGVFFPMPQKDPEKHQVSGSFKQTSLPEHCWTSCTFSKALSVSC